MGILIKNRYKLINTLSEGLVSTVWLASDKQIIRKKETEVIVKTIKKSDITGDIDSIIYFKNIVNTLSQKDLRVAPRIIDKGEIGDKIFIVMEKISGTPLNEYLTEAMSINEKVDLFINIAKALNKLHDLGVVHNNIKPSNILIKSGANENTDVSMIGIDLSFLLKDEVMDKLLEQNINYISPEQIGLIQKDIDKKSDMYLMGIVFYEMLTNHLPIVGDDINELLYNQISRRPDSPSKYNNKIDETLEQIIFKLLEKDPQSRYGSTQGLLHDLGKYKKGNRNFKLGLFDENINIKYNVNMVGREKELSYIETIFSNLEKSEGKFVIIEGNQGIGKRRLLDEFKNSIHGRRALVVDSKDTLVEKNGKYSLIRNIIFLIVKEIKTYSNDDQNQMVNKLRKELGEWGALLINISPELEEILYKYSTVTNLTGGERVRKEYQALDIFFKSMDIFDKALIILVNKIDVIDKESLEYLKHFAGEISKHKIMILATCKNNIKDLNNVEVIKLKLLDYSNVNEMVSELLNYDSDKTEKITDIVYRKSSGNPRYTLQVLKQLVSQNIVNKKDGEWVYNENKVKETDIADSFLDVQIKEILDMSDDELYVLTVLACIGKEVEVDVLEGVLGRSKEQTSLILDRFCESKLIEFNDFKYSFLSEKIRENLIARVKKDNEKLLHNRIANSLEKKYADNKEYILNIYEHFKKADNKEKMEEYAKKVKELNIYNLDSKLALECFDDILKIKNDPEYKKMVAKIHYMLGELDIAALLFKELYNVSETEKDKIGLIVNLINIYNKKQEYTKSENYIEIALNILNIKIPKNRFIMWLDYINDSTMIKGREKDKENIENKIELYIALASYYKGKDDLKSKYFAKKQYNLMKCLQGNKNIEIEAINAFHEYCRNSSTRLLDITINERDELKHRYQIAYTYKLYGEYYEKRGQYKEAIDKYVKSANLYKSINNDFCYYKIQSKIFDNDYNLSLYRDAMEINKDYSEFVSNKYEQYNIKAYSNFLKIYIAYNDTKNIDEYKRKIQDFLRDNDNIDTPLYIYALKVLGMMELENGTIVEAIERFKNIILLKNTDASVYLYLVEAYIEQLLSNDKFVLLEKNVIISDINRLLKRARKLCSRVEKGRYYYQKARFYSFLEKNTRANEYYNASIRVLYKFNDQYMLARVYTDYAKFLNDNGDKERCTENLEKAYIIFSKIGAQKYIDKIRKHFNLIINEQEKISMAKKVKYAAQLEIVLKLNQHISSMLNINDLLDKVLKIAIEYTGATGGCIFTIDRGTRYLKKRLSYFISNEVYSKEVLKLVQDKKKSLLIANASCDERFLSDRDVLINDIKSVIAVPIKYGDDIKGICYLSNNLAEGVFDERDLEILELLMSQAAISLENAELYEMAITDGLTGLITHKHFKYIATQELEKSIRHKRDLSIAMLDIDHFKKFNDTYGHQAGDYVLAEVARMTKELFRLSDSVARYGGEEFVILMPDTDEEGGFIACERLRKKIEEKVFLFGEDSFSVTVSMGIAELKSPEQTVEEIIKASDLALYKSKETGRNKVTKAELS
ncbi:MAG: diguanylate cyclase [Clostridiales bacterium]|nr:diguanylate cyclase [Clostridiales bacterium]